MLLQTLSGDWQKLKATNFTSADFGTLKSTTTEPTGDGVIDMANKSGATQNGIRIKPFGTDANNETFSMRVWGWDRILLGGIYVWENILICEVACTLGNLAGAALCAITASDFEVDTITLTTPAASTSIYIHTQAVADVRGAFLFADTFGSRLVQIEFDMGTGASANALVRSL